MTASLVIGIDGGATRATAVALDTDDRIVARVEGDALVVRGSEHGRVAGAAAALAGRALDEAGAARPARALCCALTGAGRESERKSVEALLHATGIAVSTHVVTDAEAAFFDAFADGPGMLLIAGTGSIAWGRSAGGTTHRVGGWGPIAGDEGSAWAIGQAALRAALAAYDGRAAPGPLSEKVLAECAVDGPPDLVRWAEQAGKRGVAALAPGVLSVAQRDPTAAQLASNAVDDLARHIHALVARIAAPEPVPLALAGGLLAPARPLRELLLQRLRSTWPRLNVLEDDVDAARGAARIARRRAATDR